VNAAINCNTRSGLTFDGLTVRHADHTATYLALFLYHSTDITVRNCDVGYCACGAMRFNQPHGAFLIENNKIHHLWNGKTYASGGGGPGALFTWDTGGTASLVTIRRNYIHDNYVGYYWTNTTDLPVLAYQNLITKNYVDGVGIRSLVLHRFFNNVVYHKPNPAVITNNGHGLILRNATTVNVAIKNNLFIFTENGVVGADLIQIDDSTFAFVDIDHNQYWAIGTPSVIFNAGGSQGTSFAEWKTWLNTTSYSGKDANSGYGNPLVIDVATDDFRLRRGSPCFDAGVDVGLTTDPDGWSIPLGAGPDIGAYECRRCLAAVF